MRLVLEQKTWTEVDRDQAAGRALPYIVLHPSEPWDENAPTRKKAYLEWDLPAGASVTVLSDEPALSSVDWPIKIVEARVMKGGDVVEARVLVIYGILEYLVAAMWRGPLALLEAKRDHIFKALRGGRPDWREREIVALAQLYE